MAGSFSFETIDTERAARVALAYVAPPEDTATGHALQITGSGLGALDLALRDTPIPGLSRAEALLWRRRFDTADLDQIADGVEQSRTLGLRTLIPGDPDWPESLAVLGPREPVALWGKGDARLLAAPVSSRAALVGAYAASDYGAEWAGRVAGELTQDGYVVATTSGTGIAAEASRASLLEGGHPVVVVPRALTQTQADAAIARDGLLVSELPPGSPHPRESGRSSHRILAATSGVLTVVEAREHSTPVRTAMLARMFKREVAAVPADVTRPRQGTNRLIADGTATLVTDVEDVERLLEQQTPVCSVLGLDLRSTARALDHGTGLGR